MSELLDGNITDIFKISDFLEVGRRAYRILRLPNTQYIK